MQSLRFDKAKIKLDDAVILLATNQDPWAEHIVCSIVDYFNAGYQNSDRHMFAIFPDFFWLDMEERDPYDQLWNRIHKVSVRPDYGMAPGIVALEREF